MPEGASSGARPPKAARKERRDRHDEWVWYRADDPAGLNEPGGRRVLCDGLGRAVVVSVRRPAAAGGADRGRSGFGARG